LNEVMDSCPVTACAEILSGKWTILLIRDLAEGRSRFCELERSLEGISPRTLSLRLRALEEQGIVERHTYPEVPPRVEYSLTPKGKALLPLIENMRRYGREFALEAAGLLTEDQRSGDELEFDVEQDGAPRGPALYRYRPLTERFIAE